MLSSGVTFAMSPIFGAQGLSQDLTEKTMFGKCGKGKGVRIQEWFFSPSSPEKVNICLSPGK